MSSIPASTETVVVVKQPLYCILREKNVFRVPTQLSYYRYLLIGYKERFILPRRHILSSWLWTLETTCDTPFKSLTTAADHLWSSVPKWECGGPHGIYWIYVHTYLCICINSVGYIITYMIWEGPAGYSHLLYIIHIRVISLWGHS
jgi:hypothetical protein